MWHKDWPHQVYVGQWPIFYGPVILLLIWKTVWWRNIVFGVMDQCDTKIDLVKYMWVNDLYFMVHWFCFISCHTLELFLYFKNWCRPGVFVPLRALALVFIKANYYFNYPSDSLFIFISFNTLLFCDFCAPLWFPRFYDKTRRTHHKSKVKIEMLYLFFSIS